MSTIKYTKEGRKVSVIGKLNNADYIVQEIFVTDDGAEIPAGENFVASGLLDQPAKSWKETELEKLEQAYDRERAEWERKRNQLHAEFRRDCDTLKERCKQARAYLKQEELPDRLMLAFEQAASFLSGEFTHIFVDSPWPKITTFDESAMYRDGSRIEGMKLISLFGRSDGSLEWRLSRYYDGSGDSVEIYPTTSYEDALCLVQGKLNHVAGEYVDGKRKYIDLDDWRKIDGIKIPEDAEQLFQKNKAADLERRIDQKKKELQEMTEKLEAVIAPAKKKRK